MLLIKSVLGLNAPAPAASAALPANDQLSPEQVTHDDRIEAVTACLGQVLPRGIITLIARQAMERFDDAIFGRQQWIDCWGATPVTFTRTLPELRGLVNLKVISGAETEKPVEEMNEVECANFLGGVDVCSDENLGPPDELFECLNRQVRPQDKSLAGFTCTVTYIPQFVRKDGRILAVTARTLGLDLGPNPVQGESAKLLHPDHCFDKILTPEDANRTEPSCYFVMEREVALNTIGKKPSVLFAEINQQWDKCWQLPEPRNFIAAVFSRRAWKGEFLYGIEAAQTFGQGKNRDGFTLVFGYFSAEGLHVGGYGEVESNHNGASGSRKFFPAKIH